MCHELNWTVKLFGKQHGFQTVLNALDRQDMQTCDESIHNNNYSQLLTVMLVLQLLWSSKNIQV